MLRLSVFSLPTLILAVALSSGLLASSAHAAGDMAQEYDQVRKIALRDPKVKDAFDRANERLRDKIVELDPALKSYVATHAQQGAPAAAVQAPAPAPAPHHVATAAPAPAPHHFTPAPAPAKHALASGARRSHVVAPGETIGGIASQYHVSAASIEAANHITDPRKLRAGQSLVIPGAGEAPAASAPAPAASHTAAAAVPAPAPAPEPAQQEGVWEKLKHSF